MPRGGPIEVSSGGFARNIGGKRLTEFNFKRIWPQIVLAAMLRYKRKSSLGMEWTEKTVWSDKDREAHLCPQPSSKLHLSPSCSVV